MNWIFFRLFTYLKLIFAPLHHNLFFLYFLNHTILNLTLLDLGSNRNLHLLFLLFFSSLSREIPGLVGLLGRCGVIANTDSKPLRQN